MSQAPMWATLVASPNSVQAGRASSDNDRRGQAAVGCCSAQPAYWALFVDPSGSPIPRDSGPLRALRDNPKSSSHG